MGKEVTKFDVKFELFFTSKSKIIIAINNNDASFLE